MDGFRRGTKLKRFRGLKLPAKNKRNEDIEETVNVVKKFGTVVWNYQLAFSETWVEGSNLGYWSTISKLANELIQKVEATKWYLIESCSESMLSITINEPLHLSRCAHVFKLKNLIRERSWKRSYASNILLVDSQNDVAFKKWKKLWLPLKILRAMMASCDKKV